MNEWIKQMKTLIILKSIVKLNWYYWFMANLKIEWCGLLVCHWDKNKQAIGIGKRNTKQNVCTLYNTCAFSTHSHVFIICTSFYTANKSVDQLFMDTGKSDANHKPSWETNTRRRMVFCFSLCAPSPCMCVSVHS